MISQPFSVWITGISAAGKSTLAAGLHGALRARGIATQILDGEDVRRGIGGSLGFSEEDRLLNTRRILYINALLARNGINVIVAAICPVRAGRDEARATLPRFVEVFLDPPVDVCRERDTKGVYRRGVGDARPNIVGIDVPFERSPSPEVLIDTSRLSPDESLRRVLAYLERCPSS